MLARLNEQQRLGLVGLCLISLVVVGYTASSCARKPANVTISPEVQQAALNAQGAGPDAGPATVHVAGEVKKPGLYKLPSDARINDAIELAGGPTQKADLGRVNLAEKVTDGSQIRVPSIDDPSDAPTVQRPVESAAVSVGSSRGGSHRTKQVDLVPGSISINAATAQELDALPGVGPATAAKILEYRQSHGGFKSIDELTQVKGIGPKKLEAMRRYLRL